MIKFEIPYNLDPAYPEKLLQRPALIPYIDCIYLLFCSSHSCRDL